MIVNNQMNKLLTLSECFNINVSCQYRSPDQDHMASSYQEKKTFLPKSS